MENKKCLIIAGGSLSEKFTGFFLEKNPEWAGARLICADRGLDCARALGLWPDLIAGDFDSASRDELNWWKNREKEGKTRILSFNPKKDLTDTHAALIEAMKEEPDEILILGAMGGRQDHFLGNLNLLMLPLKKGIKAFLLDQQNKIYLADHGFEIEKKECFGRYISFIPFIGPLTNVTMRGFLYETRGITMDLGDSLGISNEVLWEKASISFDSGVAAVVESRDSFY